MMDEGMNQRVHTFEAAGLGKAPFRYIGCDFPPANGIKKVLIDGVTFETKHGGTCAYCGQAITSLFNIQSADGKRFHVGSSCVEKAGDAGIRTVVAKEKRRHDKEIRQKREEAKIDELKTLIEDEEVRKILAEVPQPVQWLADAGRTYLDSVEWVIRNAGKAGKIKTLAQVKAHLKK